MMNNFFLSIFVMGHHGNIPVKFGKNWPGVDSEVVI